MENTVLYGHICRLNQMLKLDTSAIIPSLKMKQVGVGLLLLTFSLGGGEAKRNLGGESERNLGGVFKRNLGGESERNDHRIVAGGGPPMQVKTPTPKKHQILGVCQKEQHQDGKT